MLFCTVKRKHIIIRRDAYLYIARDSRAGVQYVIAVPGSQSCIY